MPNKRKIEVFSAGCPACDDAVQMVNALACPSCEVEVLDMHRDDVAARAAQYGIRSVPAIVIDGQLSDCCSAGRGVDAEVLKAGGVGVPLE